MSREERRNLLLARRKARNSWGFELLDVVVTSVEEDLDRVRDGLVPEVQDLEVGR